MKLTSKERQLIQALVGPFEVKNGAQVRAACEILTASEFSSEEVQTVNGAGTPEEKQAAIIGIQPIEVTLRDDSQLFLSHVLHRAMDEGKIRGFDALVVAPLLDLLPAPPERPEPPTQQQPEHRLPGARGAQPPPAHQFAR